MRIQVERTFCNDSELMQDFEQKLPIMCPFSKRVTEYHVLHSPVHRVNWIAHPIIKKSIIVPEIEVKWLDGRLFPR